MYGRNKISPPLEQEITVCWLLPYSALLCRNAFSNTTAVPPLPPPAAASSYCDIFTKRKPKQRIGHSGKQPVDAPLALVHAFEYRFKLRLVNVVLAVRRNARAVQQGVYPDDVLWQHSTGPAGGGQAIAVQPVGQDVAGSSDVEEAFVTAVAFLATGAVFFASAFLVDGATAASSAHAGATRTKVNKHSSILFIFISLGCNILLTFPRKTDSVLHTTSANLNNIPHSSLPSHFESSIHKSPVTEARVKGVGIGVLKPRIGGITYAGHQ